MNAQGRQTGSLGDELTNNMMVALMGIFGVALVVVPRQVV